MTIRTRLANLKRSLGDLPPPGRLDLVVADPVGSGMADDLPPCVHLTAGGWVATVVFEGAGPDEAVMARLGEAAHHIGSSGDHTPVTEPRVGGNGHQSFDCNSRCLAASVAGSVRNDTRSLSTIASNRG